MDLTLFGSLLLLGAVLLVVSWGFQRRRRSLWRQRSRALWLAGMGLVVAACLATLVGG